MKKILFPVFIFFLMVFNSCDEFMDINDDPNNPSDATIIQLLPAGQAGTVFGLTNALNRIASDNVQYFNGSYDSWDVSPDDVSNAWRFALYAGGLVDLEQVIQKGTESENYHFVGVSKLCKAYTYSVMVDVWDDIPYNEATNNEFEYPNFDDARSIYDNIFSLIDEALGDLEKPLQETAADLSSVDLIYGGNISNWKRMAATLKLKMYNQIRLVDSGLAKAQIESLASSGNLINSNGQDFAFQYGVATTPENRYPGYIADYETKGLTYINTFFYTTMFDKADPRIPYYFYNQTDAFMGRFTGDPEASGNDQDERTLIGMYPSGGKYDDGSATAASGSSALGNGKFRMITYAMRMFIECEAAITLNATVSDTPKNLLQKALQSTFAEVNMLGGPRISIETRDAYIDARLQAFDDAATDDDKLAIVMEEKWIAMFGNAIEAFTDYRRTGYPELPDPLVASNNVVSNRFPYPSDELSSNPNAPEQLENNVKVFWDN